VSFARLLPRSVELLRFAPHHDSHWVVLRTGLSVGIPLAVLTATGYDRWSLYAALGAFTAIFGRSDGYRRRLHTQAAAASAHVLAVVLSAPRWPQPGQGLGQS